MSMTAELLGRPRRSIIRHTHVMGLWVDELRDPLAGWLEQGKEECEAIETHTNVMVTELSLNHDLGGDHTTRPVGLWTCKKRHLA